MIIRPRRNRQSPAIRRLVRETVLTTDDLILPLFVKEGQGQKEAITSMPGCYRLSIDLAVALAREAWDLGIPGVALFPLIENDKKDALATESRNPQGLVPRAVKAIKQALPDLLIFTDVAMDPYSSDGHDGVVKNGEIVNDETLKVLGEMALVQAQAGADFVAPSDMMDGRVGYLRKTLDAAGFEKVGILAYSAKYASAYYGPFRDALESTPRFGDKKTYQMDPANELEAEREVLLDIDEGADIVMVKPALAYLDIIRRVKDISTVPVAAYNVSGEYAMIKAAAERGWLDHDRVMMETVTAIKRAGADIILTYFAVDIAKKLNS